MFPFLCHVFLLFSVLFCITPKVNSMMGINVTYIGTTVFWFYQTKTFISSLLCLKQPINLKPRVFSTLSERYGGKYLKQRCHYFALMIYFNFVLINLVTVFKKNL